MTQRSPVRVYPRTEINLRIYLLPTDTRSARYITPFKKDDDVLFEKDPCASTFQLTDNKTCFVFSADFDRSVEYNLNVFAQQHIPHILPFGCRVVQCSGEVSSTSYRGPDVANMIASRTPRQLRLAQNDYIIVEAISTIQDYYNKEGREQQLVQQFRRSVEDGELHYFAPRRRSIVNNCTRSHREHDNIVQLRDDISVLDLLELEFWHRREIEDLARKGFELVFEARTVTKTPVKSSACKSYTPTTTTTRKPTSTTALPKSSTRKLDNNNTVSKRGGILCAVPFPNLDISSV
eukprot:PhM_4_TR11036/c0_g2_i1/m.31456